MAYSIIVDFQWKAIQAFHMTKTGILWGRGTYTHIHTLMILPKLSTYFGIRTQVLLVCGWLLHSIFVNECAKIHHPKPNKFYPSHNQKSSFGPLPLPPKKEKSGTKQKMTHNITANRFPNIHIHKNYKYWSIIKEHKEKMPEKQRREGMAKPKNVIYKLKLLIKLIYIESERTSENQWPKTYHTTISSSSSSEIQKNIPSSFSQKFQIQNWMCAYVSICHTAVDECGHECVGHRNVCVYVCVYRWIFMHGKDISNHPWHYK